MHADQTSEVQGARLGIVDCAGPDPSRGGRDSVIGIRLTGESAVSAWMGPLAHYRLRYDGVGWAVTGGILEGVHRLTDRRDGAMVDRLPLEDGPGHLDLVRGLTYLLRQVPVSTDYDGTVIRWALHLA